MLLEETRSILRTMELSEVEIVYWSLWLDDLRWEDPTFDCQKLLWVTAFQANPCFVAVYRPSIESKGLVWDKKWCFLNAKEEIDSVYPCIIQTQHDFPKLYKKWHAKSPSRLSNINPTAVNERCKTLLGTSLSKEPHRENRSGKEFVVDYNKYVDELLSLTPYSQSCSVCLVAYCRRKILSDCTFLRVRKVQRARKRKGKMRFSV
eukprot:TRINITY_DN9516_c0_g2_i1.p1 TRINITY_DN9516_c0_g2~~TRINITY_DN9516_c0_g2_i1.p1  ORF type:complete len:205 (-),score=34.83 TRINITY_DN9516_c0_g2_i1:549-1163(-)